MHLAKGDHISEVKHSSHRTTSAAGKSFAIGVLNRNRGVGRRNFGNSVFFVFGQITCCLGGGMPRFPPPTVLFMLNWPPKI